MTPKLQEEINKEVENSIGELQRKVEDDPVRLHDELQAEVDKSAGISQGVYTPDMATDPTSIHKTLLLIW